MIAACAHFEGQLEFQSAPLTDVRGDGRPYNTVRRTSQVFQSAPLTDVRGD